MKNVSRKELHSLFLDVDITRLSLNSLVPPLSCAKVDSGPKRQPRMWGAWA